MRRCNGDHMALIYHDSEIIDFAIALMGCSIAGNLVLPIYDFDNYFRHG